MRNNNTQVFLEVVARPGTAGRSIWLYPGDVCRFGSKHDSDLRLPDSSVPPVAGTLLGTSAGANLYSARGVRRADREAGPMEVLASGDVITCGSFRIIVRVWNNQSSSTAAPPDPPATPIEALIGWISRSRGNLYAVYDSARSPRVLELLAASGCAYVSLFEGTARVRMADAAPYLVAIPRNSPALELLIRASWGNGWASFLTSQMSVDEVRARLRRSLLAKLPDGETCYFRFFDPAVLQAFLPASNASELDEFARGITEFVVEHSENPGIAVRFYLPGSAEQQNRIEIHALHEIGEGSPVYERAV